MDELEFKCDFNSFYPYICDTSHVQRIVHCDKDTRNYLYGLKCSESIAGKPFQSYNCPEALEVDYLLLTNVFFKCAYVKHRDNLGLSWRKSRSKCEWKWQG